VNPRLTAIMTAIEELPQPLQNNYIAVLERQTEAVSGNGWKAGNDASTTGTRLRRDEPARAKRGRSGAVGDMGRRAAQRPVNAGPVA